MQRLHIWDLPTRLCHWLLALAVVSAFITGQIGGNLIDWHGRIGIAIIGLLVFRIVWGFVGADTARFASFVRGPAAIKSYLRGEWRGHGHNPLGALSVLALLALVAAQAGTGLFANDDIAFQGPLAGLVSEALSNRLTQIHEILISLLIAMVGLHLLAIAYYTRVKGNKLLQPMLTGWKDVPLSNTDAVRPGQHKKGSLPGLLVALLAAGLVVYGVSGSWLPAPVEAAPASSSAPAW